MAAEMSIMEHFHELRLRVMRIAVTVVVISIFCMTFGVKTVQYFDTTAFYPFPDPVNNIAVQLTHYMQESLLPHDVRLIQTAPGQAFFAQMNVAIMLGVLGSLPVIVMEISGFVSPAIAGSTRKSIAKILLFVAALFTAGVIFAYLFVIPFTLDFLYRYGQAIGVETFLNINDFISFVMQFFVAFGVSFQLPIIMYVLSRTEAISPYFWRKNLRYALIAITIFGAAITPDGSGITMWLVSGPMMGLYFAGMLVVERRHLKIAQRERSPSAVSL